jgi:nitrate reductase assembly molybdenum cofactor insertion protein NarJ
MHDKEIKRLKTLVEEERNEEFIDELEGNWEKRNSDYENLISVIKRVADEVRDSKRFNVYKQLYEKKE